MVFVTGNASSAWSQVGFTAGAGSDYGYNTDECLIIAGYAPHDQNGNALDITRISGTESVCGCSFAGHDGLQVQGLTAGRLTVSGNVFDDGSSTAWSMTAAPRRSLVAGLLRPLVDQDLSVVFYDLTTIRAEGATRQQGDVRQFGMSKEGVIARQFMLGVVQTAEGIPLYHEVFDGNTSETTTLLPTVQKVLARFPSLKRVVLVADRGLLSLDNLEALRAAQVRDGQPLEFILAVPGRRYGEFTGLLADFQARCKQATDEVIGELKWNKLRLVVAHDPVRAQEQSELRKARLADLEKRADEYAQKLEAQSAGIKARGRKLSSSGAKARVYHHVADAHLLKILKVDTASDLFSYDLDEVALAKAELMDGKLLLVTNVADLRPEQVIERYKSLADIERGFKVLKSEIEIGPVYHWLPERIRAHALICFIALILHRVMRLRLRAGQAGISPERALSLLQRIQHHRVLLDDKATLSGVSMLDEDQTQALKALEIRRPTDDAQLTLL